MSRFLSSRARRMALMTGLAALAGLAAMAVEAGGVIDWAGPIAEVESAGASAGQSLVGIAVLVFGISIALSIFGILDKLASLALGGVIMASVLTVKQIFGATGGGGGSFLDTTYHASVSAAGHALHQLPLF